MILNDRILEEINKKRKQSTTHKFTNRKTNERASVRDSEEEGKLREVIKYHFFQV